MGRLWFIPSFILLGVFLVVFPTLAVVGPDPDPNAPRDLVAPSNVSNVILQSDGVKINITWTDPPEGDFYRVEILRNDGDGTPVTGVTRAFIEKGVQRFEDREVTAGQTYIYQFRVSDLSFNTRLSGEYSAKVETPAPAESSTSPAPQSSQPQQTTAETQTTSQTSAGVSPETSQTPAANGLSETLTSGTFAYGFARVRSLTTEQVLAIALANYLDEILPGVFNRLFHQSTSVSKQWWYTYVNAYVYGGYTLSEIKQSVRFGGKTVHPTISATQWRSSQDYQAYINL